MKKITYFTASALIATSLTFAGTAMATAADECVASPARTDVIKTPAVGSPTITIENPDYVAAVPEQAHYIDVPAVTEVIHHPAKVKHHPAVTVMEYKYVEYNGDGVIWLRSNTYKYARENGSTMTSKPSRGVYYTRTTDSRFVEDIPAWDEVIKEAWDETITITPAHREKVIDVHYVAAIGEQYINVPNPDYIPAREETVEVPAVECPEVEAPVTEPEAEPGVGAEPTGETPSAEPETEEPNTGPEGGKDAERETEAPVTDPEDEAPEVEEPVTLGDDNTDDAEKPESGVGDKTELTDPEAEEPKGTDPVIKDNTESTTPVVEQTPDEKVVEDESAKEDGVSDESTETALNEATIKHLPATGASNTTVLNSLGIAGGALLTGPLLVLLGRRRRQSEDA